MKYIQKLTAIPAGVVVTRDGVLPACKTHYVLVNGANINIAYIVGGVTFTKTDIEPGAYVLELGGVTQFTITSATSAEVVIQGD